MRTATEPVMHLSSPSHNHEVDFRRVAGLGTLSASRGCISLTDGRATVRLLEGPTAREVDTLSLAVTSHVILIREHRAVTCIVVTGLYPVPHKMTHLHHLSRDK